MQDPDTETAELFTQLAGGGIHLLCFADPDSVCTTQLMQDGAGLDETERQLSVSVSTPKTPRAACGLWQS